MWVKSTLMQKKLAFLRRDDFVAGNARELDMALEISPVRLAMPPVAAERGDRPSAAQARSDVTTAVIEDGPSPSHGQVGKHDTPLRYQH